MFIPTYTFILFNIIMCISRNISQQFKFYALFLLISFRQLVTDNQENFSCQPLALARKRFYDSSSAGVLIFSAIGCLNTKVVTSFLLSKNEEKMMPNSQNYEKLRYRYLNFQFKKIVHFQAKKRFFPPIMISFS